jgi:hypothetical protein
MKEVFLVISYTKSSISTLPRKFTKCQYQATRNNEEKEEEKAP